MREMLMEVEGKCVPDLVCNRFVSYSPLKQEPQIKIRCMTIDLIDIRVTCHRHHQFRKERQQICPEDRRHVSTMQQQYTHSLIVAQINRSKFEIAAPPISICE
jgi:hypothetical protein